jgi:hypothetical protein
MQERDDASVALVLRHVHKLMGDQLGIFRTILPDEKFHG